MPTPTRTLPPPARPVDFDAVAGVYDSVFPAHVAEHYLHRRGRYILDLVGRPARPRSTSEPAPASSPSAWPILGLDVVALDPFPRMLAQLRRRRPDFRTVEATGHAIPFPDGRFDLTYCVAVMHHIAAPDLVRATLAEMVRVTRPGGTIVVWDHNPLNPYWPLLMRRVPQDNGAERLVPMAELLAGLRDAGAEIRRAERLGLIPEFLPARLLPAAAALEHLAEATPGLRNLCAHNVVVAGKR
jgi:SAM-dependent methyltransferase